VAEAAGVTVDVLSLPLGAYQTNCYVVSTPGSGDAVVIDPGDDAPAIERMLAERGLRPRAILVTHGHLDHIGAVRDLASSAGCEVWMARGDADDLRGYPPAPYEPDHEVGGGDTVEVAGIGFRVLDVPGHTAGSVAYATDGVAFVGDVLFAGSVGRTDLAGGDMGTLLESIALLMRELPGDTVVASGHGPATTLAHERATNPFLAGLR
jgi:hydroxyacylglutathione hydrolase